MHLTIDHHSGIPVSAQIAEQVKYFAVSGQISSGEQIPSVRALAEQLKVNPTTIARVYRQLESEGVIHTHPGRGTFIAPLRAGLTLAEKRSRMQADIRRLVVEAGRIGLNYDELQRLVAREIDAILKQTERKAS